MDELITTQCVENKTNDIIGTSLNKHACTYNVHVRTVAKINIKLVIQNYFRWMF